MWFISTSKPRISTTINTSSYSVSIPHHLWHLTYNLTDHHVWTVEARGLHPPPVGSISWPQPLAVLCSTGTGWARHSSSNAISPPVVGARLFLDYLIQWYDIQTAAFHHLNGLCHSVAHAIQDVYFPNSKPSWEWGPVERWLRRHVQATGALGGCLGEGVWHPCWGEKGRKKKVNSRTGYCRIYSRPFFW